MNIFETIRKQTNQQNAESVRSATSQQVKQEVYAAALEAMKGYGRPELDRFLDAYLAKSADFGIGACMARFPDIQGDSESAKAAREALQEAVVLAGQYLKETVWLSVSPVLSNLHIRTAETLSSVLCEVHAEQYRSRSTPALPLPEEK